MNQATAIITGAYTIWLRDIIRFWRDRARIVGALAQPTLYLFVLGLGLSTLFGRGTGPSYLQFIYPGVIGMSILFTSIFSAISIVWDREFGFLKEVLVAPIPRSAVALGKSFGGASVATLQGTIMLIYAPLVGINLGILQIVGVILLMFLISFSLTALGVLVAARLRSMEGFQMIMNFLMMPIFLLSGAMFPVTNLPSWLGALVQVDPLTYGVDALRNVVGNGSGSALATTDLAQAAPGFPTTALGAVYPLWLDILIVAGFGLLMTAAAVAAFSESE